MHEKTQHDVEVISEVLDWQGVKDLEIPRGIICVMFCHKGRKEDENWRGSGGSRADGSNQESLATPRGGGDEEE